MTISILEWVRRGREKNQQDFREKEVIRRGVLRAGDTGLMSEEGDIAHCHRKTHLRQLGIVPEVIDTDKLIMFELGFANEDIVAEGILHAAREEGYVLLREEEIPISWTTSNGTTVSGRPDIVICRREVDEKRGVQDVPVLGLELKSVHSIWTMRDVLFNRKPKLDHVAQAAHYMWKLGTPYKLYYKGYSILGQSIANWSYKLFPKPGEFGAEYVDYSEGSDGKISIRGTKQFEIAYDLRIDKNGRVEYRVEGDEGKWHPTLVTIQSVERYYEFVSKMAPNKELGPRPKSLDLHGEKLNYSVCDKKYCPLSATCDKFEDAGYEKWLEEARKLDVNVKK